MNHSFYMGLAIKEAEKAFENGEVPVGVVIVHEERVIAKAHNQVELLKDPTAHAEILAITQAAEALQTKWLNEATLYTTLEPCVMCAGAIIHARVRNLFYGADDVKAGACGSALDVISSPKLNHLVNVTSGIEALKAEALLKSFFLKLRRKKGD